MGLSEILPQPRRMTLGGVTCLVSPLRLSDLAILEEWGATRQPTPLDQANPRILETPEGPDRDRLVRDCWNAVEAREGESEFGAPGLTALLGTEEGVRMVLTLVLSRHREVDANLLDLIVDHMTTAEWDQVERHAYACHPYEELRRWIDPPPPPANTAGRTTTWSALYRHLAEERPWLSPQAFGDLTLSQLRAITGEFTAGGPRPGEDPIEFALRRGKFFDPEPEPAEKPRKPRKRKPKTGGE